MAVSLSGLDLSFLKNSPPAVPSLAADEARQIEMRSVRASKRSDLPCPRIILDRTEYRSMETGEMITSRNQHREHLKRHKLIELGNEKPRIESPEEKRRKHLAEIRKDLLKALEQKRQGYVEPPVERADDTIIVSTTPTRSNAKKAAPKIIT